MSNSFLFAQGSIGKLYYFTRPGGIPTPYLGYVEYPGDTFTVIDDVQLSDLTLINGKLFTAEYLDVISYDTSNYQPVDTFPNVYGRHIAGWGNTIGVVSIAKPFFRLYDIASHNLIFSLDTTKLPEIPGDMVISNDRAFLLLGDRVVAVDLVIEDTIATVATHHPFGFGGQNVFMVDAGNDLYIDVEYATGAIRFSLMRMDEFTLEVDTVFHNEGYANYTEPVLARDKIYLGGFDSHYDIAGDSLFISPNMFASTAIEYDDASGAVFLNHNPGNGINYFMNGNFSDTITVDGIVNKALFVPISSDTIDRIKEIKGVELHLYPNPSSGIVHVELADKSPIKEIQLLDISGRVIEKKMDVFSLSSFSIDCSILHEGYYFLKIVTREGTYSTRFIK